MHSTLIGLASLALASALPDPLPVNGDGPTDSPGVRAEVLAIHASTIVVGDGSVIEDGVLLVEGDRIRAVGAGIDVPEGAISIEHDGFLTAGMVAPHSTLLPGDERSDSTDPFMAEAELRYGFDPGRDEVEAAARNGVTSAVLTSSSGAVVGGLTAVVKTHGGVVIDPRAHLSVSMTSSAANQNRYPTSYAGIVRELLERFGEGATGTYAEARAGELPVLIQANGNDECQRAMYVAEANGLRGALLGARRVGEQLEALRASGLGVVFTVLGTGNDERDIDAMVAVAQSDVTYGFALTDPTNLRLTGATLVRAGADANSVWTALTSGGARLAGVADSVGTLKRGMHADLCLWSGHPLDLTSTLEGVMIGGERVELSTESEGANH
ncbi:MAG: amidohydrolase family protein [Planctomycetota bacterium]|jgi:imidazolonepropionase-like amidohydrolase